MEIASKFDIFASLMFFLPANVCFRNEFFIFERGVKGDESCEKLLKLWRR
jgi:hypothetical protein